MINEEFEEKFKNVKLVLLDCDGVMTDGFVYVNDAGNEYARFSHKDGMGIKMLKQTGTKVIVITTQVTWYVTARCRKMAIPCHQAVENKTECVRQIIAAENIDFNDVVFMGDDVNDLGAMGAVGLPIAVANAEEEVKKIAVYITKRKGGEHAVREVCNLILEAKKEAKDESRGV